MGLLYAWLQTEWQHGTLHGCTFKYKHRKLFCKTLFCVLYFFHLLLFICFVRLIFCIKCLLIVTLRLTYTHWNTHFLVLYIIKNESLTTAYFYSSYFIRCFSQGVVICRMVSIAWSIINIVLSVSWCERETSATTTHEIFQMTKSARVMSSTFLMLTMQTPIH